MDQLPDARRQICRVLGQKAVQKRGAGAQQTGNEDRPRDRLFEYVRRFLLFLMEAEEVRQKPDDVPAGRDPPDEAEIGLREAGSEKFVQSSPERRFAECP